jgi:nucleoside-diphosphate-sugar epimerase
MKRLPIEDLEHIYQNTRDIWESFRGKSIFLTGGTGFFGKWLLESFIYANEKLNLNAKITTLSRNPEKFLNENIFYRKYINNLFFIKGDVLTFNYDINDQFDYIIHGATTASDTLNNESPLLMLDTIILGTKKILEFANKQKLKGFLFISSGAIYGKQPENVQHIKESDSFKVDINNSNSAYSEGKRAAELYCSIYATKHSIPIKIARCFAFVGPYLPLDTNFAIGNFIKNFINKENIIIKGDGTPLRSYLYASDLSIWLWKILAKGGTNSVYNVGSNESTSITALAKKILDNNYNESLKLVITKPKINSELLQYVPSIDKAKIELGLRVNIDLDTAIKKTKLFYLSK